MTQRTLITGIGGFSGRHLAHVLRTEPSGELFGLGTAAATDVACTRYFCCDLTDPRAVQHAVDEARPDVVYHLAARTAGTAERMHDVNVRGFVNLCDALRRRVATQSVMVKSRPVRMVVVGSAAELGATGTAKLPVAEDALCEPETVYGRTKWEVTRRALREPAHGPLRISVARTFNLVGPGLGSNLALGRFVEQIAAFARGEIGALRCGNLAARRDYVDVREAVAAYVAIAKHGLPGELYHVCRGESHEIGTLLSHLVAASGLNIPIEIDSTPRPGDLADVYGDPTKTTRATGWRASTPIETSLEAMLGFVMQMGSREWGMGYAERRTPLRPLPMPHSTLPIR